MDPARLGTRLATLTEERCNFDDRCQLGVATGSISLALLAGLASGTNKQAKHAGTSAPMFTHTNGDDGWMEYDGGCMDEQIIVDGGAGG